VVIENIDGPAILLRNRGVAGNHWISFEFAGTKSNRLGIGARVRIVANGVAQTSDVRSGGSYLSQNDLRVHFGSAAATRADEVEIRWPSGTVDVLKNLDADKLYYVLEGKEQVPAVSIRPDVSAKK
jgi:hypothetical protein